jgi:hypothetical protein
MHKPGVSLDTPPNSAHFDITKCLKTPKEENVSDAIGQIPTITAPPKPTEYPYSYPHPHPPPWMYHYPMPSSFPMPMLPTHPYSAAISNLSVPNPYMPNAESPLPASRKNLRLKVSPDLFCARYNVDLADQKKLELLGYRPGDDNILKLEPEDWKEVKFTKLGWMNFLDAHRQFLRDIKAGQWDYLATSL